MKALSWCISLLALAASLPATGSAQSAPTPVAAAPLAWNADPVRAELSNGLEVWIVRDDRAPFFEAALVITAGYRHDPLRLPGLAVLAREAVGWTATGLSRHDVDRTLDSLGLRLEIGGAPLPASGRAATFRLAGLSPGMEPGVQLLARLVTDASVADSVLMSARQGLVADLRTRTAQPRSLALTAVDRLLAGALSRHALPDSADLARISSDDVRAFHRANYRPDRALLLLVAPGDPAQQIRLLERAFGGWQAAAEPNERDASLTHTTFDGGPARQDHVVAGASQAVFALAFPAPAPGGDGHARWTLVRMLLTTRLGQVLRGERGWTYGVSIIEQLDNPLSTAIIHASVPPEHLWDALRETLRQLEMLRTQLVTDDDLLNAKHRRMSARTHALERRSFLVDQLATQHLLDLPHDYWPRFEAALLAVSPTDLRALAQEFLDPSRFHLALVGDEAALARVPADWFRADGGN